MLTGKGEWGTSNPPAGLLLKRGQHFQKKREDKLKQAKNGGKAGSGKGWEKRSGNGVLMGVKKK